MKCTYYGHACFSVTVAGKKLLFDPFISGNELAKSIHVDEIEADYILVSHGHGDHVGDLVQIAKRTGALVIGAYEVVAWAQKQGVERVHGMNFGPFNFEFGKLRFTPALHSSSMPDGSYGGNPGGFLIQTAEGTLYYSGDTCLMTDMQLIPRFAKPDVAILPIGGNFTMDAEEALMAAEMIQCRRIIGVHYDTFPPIKIDHAAAQALFQEAGMELLLPGIGQSLEL